MKRRTKIVGAIMAAALFGSIFVGSTLALYSTAKKVNNHIVSGDFHAMLYLTGLQQDVLNANGTIAEDQVIDLSNYVGYDDTLQAVNLAEYNNEVIAIDKIVPTMEGKADFKIIIKGVECSVNN